MSLLDSDQAQKEVRGVQSSRFLKLDELERYTSGKQYDGREPFFADSDVPLIARAPHIVYPIAGLAIESHVSMVLGEGRFPTITTCGDEDDSDAEDDDDPHSGRAPVATSDGAPRTETAPIEFGLSEDDSERLDRLIRKVCKQSRFSTACAAMLEAAMGCGSTVAIASVHRGRLKINVEASKHCTATRDESGDIVRLEIQRAYLEEYRDPARQNQLAVKAMVYRRVIDATTDTVYKPQEAKTAVSLRQQDWPAAQVREHGYGFCPVHWYAFDADMDGNDCPDGHAIHERLLDEITALDRSLSQWDRAVLYNADPIVTEIGVDGDHEPAPQIEVVSDLRYMSTEQVNAEAQFQRDWGGRNRQQVRKGRKRAPGMAYHYPNPLSKVEFLTLPPGAFEALEKKTADLESKLTEALHWCPIDPKTMQMSSALSGRAIEWLHKKQTDYDVTVRTDFGDNGLLPLLDLLLRIAYTIGKDPLRGRGLYLQGLQEALPVLARFERTQSTGHKAPDGSDEIRTVWMSPEIDLVWPPFFPSTEVDQKAIGENVRADLQAGLIRQRTAVEKTAPYYGIKNIDAYMDGLEDDAKHKVGSIHAAQDALAKMAGDVDDDAPAALPEPMHGKPATMNGKATAARVDMNAERR